MNDADYIGDVQYEAWRRGLNPDRLDYDRIVDAAYDGLSAEEFVNRECRAEEERRQQQITQQEECEAEMYRQDQYLKEDLAEIEKLHPLSDDDIPF